MQGTENETRKASKNLLQLFRRQNFALQVLGFLGHSELSIPVLALALPELAPWGAGPALFLFNHWFSFNIRE